MSDLEMELYSQMVLSVLKLCKTKKIGISFSGGVDSSLLAKITDGLGYDIILLTIGFENSHDVSFSKKIAKMMGFKHEIDIISDKNFPDIAKQIWEMNKIDNLSWNENCIAFYYVSRLAKRCNIGEVLTANGIDELFCGYNSYRKSISDGKEAVMDMMKIKLENEIKLMQAVNRVSFEFGVHFMQPFLDKKFIDLSEKIPLREKIIDEDDLMRKHIIRKLATSMGVPKESTSKRKKAMQYGSLIHKNLVKIKKTWNNNS